MVYRMIMKAASVVDCVHQNSTRTGSMMMEMVYSLQPRKELLAGSNETQIFAQQGCNCKARIVCL